MKITDVVEFDFFQKTEEWLGEIKMVKATQTYKNYRSVLDTAYRFQLETGAIWDIEFLDSDFIDNFIKYMLIECHLLESTVDKYMRTLKLFLSVTFPGRDLSFVHNIKMREKVVWLLAGELLTLKDLDVNAPWDRIRDLFLFMATTGMRYEDTQRYNHEWLESSEENFVEYTQMHPGGAAYTVLRGTAEEILKAYNGAPPIMEKKDYVNGLRALLHTMDFTRPVKVWESVGTKRMLFQKPLAFAVDETTGRQTYIMQLLTNNVPINKTMIYAGHFDYRTFRPYLDHSKRFSQQYTNPLSF